MASKWRDRGSSYRAKTKEYSRKYSHSFRHSDNDHSKLPSYNDDIYHTRRSSGFDNNHSKKRLATDKQDLSRKSNKSSRKSSDSEPNSKSKESTKLSNFTEKKFLSRGLKLLTSDKSLSKKPLVKENSSKNLTETQLNQIDQNYMKDNVQETAISLNKSEVDNLSKLSAILQNKNLSTEVNKTQAEFSRLGSISHFALSSVNESTKTSSSPSSKFTSSKYCYNEPSISQESSSKWKSSGGSSSITDDGDNFDMSEQCYSWVGEYLDDDDDLKTNNTRTKQTKSQDYLNYRSTVDIDGVPLSDTDMFSLHLSKRYDDSFIPLHSVDDVNLLNYGKEIGTESSDLTRTKPTIMETAHSKKSQSTVKSRNEQQNSSIRSILKWPSNTKFHANLDSDASHTLQYDTKKGSYHEEKRRRIDSIMEKCEHSPDFHSSNFKSHSEEISMKFENQPHASVNLYNKPSYRVKNVEPQSFRTDLELQAFHSESCLTPICDYQDIDRKISDRSDHFQVFESHKQHERSDYNDTYFNKFRFHKSHRLEENRQPMDQLLNEDEYVQTQYDNESNRMVSPVLHSDVESKYISKKACNPEVLKRHQSRQDFFYSDQRKLIKDEDVSFLEPKRQFADRRQVHDNSPLKNEFSNNEYVAKEDSLQRGQIKPSLNFSVSKSSQISHNNRNKSILSDFQGAWKAATNTSIEVADSPNLFQHNSDHLVQAINVVSTSTKFPSANKETHDESSANLHPDRREVLYTSKRNSISRFEDSFVSPGIYKSERLVISQPESQRNLPLKKTENELIQHLDGKGNLKNTVKTLADQDVEFWDKDFVDWFSKHILPTPMFQLYMENACLKMTAADLAVMPLKFLQHLEDGDYHAIKCIPKQPSEAKTLLSFLNRFKTLKDVALGIKDEVLTSKSSDEIMKTKMQVSEKMKKLSSPEDSKDTMIPVLISGKNSSLDTKPALTVSTSDDPIKPRPSTLPQTTISNLVITCNNSTNIVADNTVPNAGFSNRVVVNQTFQPVQSHSQIWGDMKQQVVDSSEKVMSASSNIRPRNLVDPRWNEEVQQFIGRAQSSSSRPIYLEYLEKNNCGLPDDNVKNVSSSKFSTHSDDQRLPTTRKDDNIHEYKRKTKSCFRHDVKQSRSDSLPYNHTLATREANISQAADGANVRSNSNANSYQKKAKKTSPGGVSRLSGKLDEKKCKSKTTSLKPDLKTTGNSDQKLRKTTTEASKRDSRSKSRLHKRSRSRSPLVRRRRTTNSQQTHSSQKQLSKSIFGTNAKRTLSTQRIQFRTEDKKIPDHGELDNYKRFFKNLAFKYLNLLYNFENYDFDKIIVIIRDAEEKIFQSSKHRFCTRMQSMYILKQLFEDNAASNIQVNLKRKLVERGKDWSSTTFQTFQLLKDEVFSACDKGLSKNVAFKLQSKRNVEDVVEKYEQLFPQFCGDVKYLIKLWIWKSDAIDCERSPDPSHLSSLKAAWREKNETVKDNVKDWLQKCFVSPPFDSSVRTYFSILSVLQSQLNKSREEVVRVIVAWWIEGYFHRRYEKFKVKPDTKKATSPKRIVESKKSNDELMIVIDEDDDTTSSDPHSKSSSNSADIMEHDLVQVDAEKEYSEDASGAPTILLY